MSWPPKVDWAPTLMAVCVSVYIFHCLNFIVTCKPVTDYDWSLTRVDLMFAHNYNRRYKTISCNIVRLLQTQKEEAGATVITAGCSKCCAHPRSASHCMVIRPPEREFGRAYVFIFFRHAFSEVPRLIALKLCHVVGIWLHFIFPLQ